MIDTQTYYIQRSYDEIGRIISEVRSKFTSEDLQMTVLHFRAFLLALGFHPDSINKYVVEV